MAGWFDVSKEGLRQLMEGREKSFIVRELIQNSWDEPSVTHCSVTIAPAPDAKGMVDVEVMDNAPEGFHDLTHAYTMFAANRKRADREKRGRFNLGEKQVLALCEFASIVTTKGEILFNKDGTRTEGTHSLPAGSVFRCRVKMSQADMKRVVAAVQCFLPPKHITTEVNGKVIGHRDPVASAKAPLTTEYEHADGGFRRTKRQTVIHIHEVRENECPTLYEMGIPVVALEGDDKYHYDIQQRVPLNSERDNVTPAFLRDVRAEVANVVAGLLTQEEAASDWAREAAGSERITEDAFKTMVEARYGEKVAAFSPTDTEACSTASAKGYTVLTGGAMTRGEWSNAKKFDAISSAASLFPTDKPKSGDGDCIPQDEWSPAMRCVCEFTADAALALIGHMVEVRIVRTPGNRFSAWYGNHALTFNLSVIGRKFFDSHETTEGRERIVELVIHELAHEYEPNHLSDSYTRAVCRLAAKAVTLALNSPRMFKLKAKTVAKSKRVHGK